MHELSLATEVVESVIRSIPPSHAGQPVTRLTLSIGKMACVTVDSLRFCLEILSRGTVLETSELVIEEVPVTATCRACGHTWTLNEPLFLCEACQSPDIHITSGREMLIRSIEIKENDCGN